MNKVIHSLCHCSPLAIAATVMNGGSVEYAGENFNQTKQSSANRAVKLSSNNGGQTVQLSTSKYEY